MRPNTPAKLVADKVADGMPTTGLNIMTDLISFSQHSPSHARNSSARCGRSCSICAIKVDPMGNSEQKLAGHVPLGETLVRPPSVREVSRPSRILYGRSANR